MSLIYIQFSLLTSYSVFVILLKAYSFNDVKSGKLYILDLLKGSISIMFLESYLYCNNGVWNLDREHLPCFG